METLTSLAALEEKIPKLRDWKCRYKLPGDLETDEYIIPVSGGSDSTALAIIMHALYPQVVFRLCFTDTGAEEPEIYTTLDQLEAYLGKKIERVSGGKGLFELIEQWNGFLPNSKARWCTNSLKRIPFEAWLKQFSGKLKYMFVGIRSDESDRVAFALNEVETEMPMIPMGLVREDVFAILSATIGIPSYYKRRTRSGCSVCPFQRRSELVGLLQEKPIEFKRGAKYEKLNQNDKERHTEAPSLSKESGIALNWLSLPLPQENEVVDGANGSKGESNIFGDTGVWIGAEVFFDSYPGMAPFSWHQRVVSYSPTLGGLKRQLQDRFEHLLKTGEVYQLSPEDVRQQCKFICYFIEAPSNILDVAGTTDGSFTWHGGESYNQLAHIIGWGTRILHAAELETSANLGKKARESSWQWEVSNESQKGLDAVKDERGRLVGKGWFTPKEPIDDGSFDEATITCPMCSL